MDLHKNEIRIQPINTWVNGVIKTLTVFKLDNYFQYDFLMWPGRVHYCLCEYNTFTDDNGVEYPNHITIIDGNVDLPLTLIENWGTDDTPIFDYVLTQLGLTRL